MFGLRKAFAAWVEKKRNRYRLEGAMWAADMLKESAAELDKASLNEMFTPQAKQRATEAASLIRSESSHLMVMASETFM